MCWTWGDVAVTPGQLWETWSVTRLSSASGGVGSWQLGAAPKRGIWLMISRGGQVEG